MDDFEKFLADYGTKNYGNEFALTGDYKEKIYRDIWNAAIESGQKTKTT
jgi:hypothetical protein